MSLPAGSRGGSGPQFAGTRDGGQQQQQQPGQGPRRPRNICYLKHNCADLRKQQLVMETMVPHLPVRVIMRPADAQAEVARLLDNVQALRDAFWFADGLEAIRRAGQNAPCGADIWDQQLATWRPRVTLAGKLRFLHLMAFMLQEHRAKEVAVGAIILTLVSFSVRGNMSAAKVTRVVAELTPTMPYAGEALTAGDIQLTWTNFGQYVDDSVMPAIIRRWLTYIPQHALRVRVVLAQAAGSGLTSLDVIARAIHENPAFPWILVQRMYPDQWDNAGLAMRRVGNNPYYGFRHNLEHVRANQFRHLAAFCGRLLIALGDESLGRYQGFQNDRLRVDVWNKLIASYVTARGREALDVERPMTDAKIRMQAAMADQVALYPANLGGLANMDGHPDVPPPRPRRRRRPGHPRFGNAADSSDDDDDDDDDGGNNGAGRGRQRHRRHSDDRSGDDRRSDRSGCDRSGTQSDGDSGNDYHMASQDPVPQSTHTLTPGQAQLITQLERLRAGLEERERLEQARTIGTDLSRSGLETLTEHEDEVFGPSAPAVSQPSVAAVSPAKSVVASSNHQSPRLETVVLGPPPGLPSIPSQSVPSPSPLRQPKYTFVDGRLVDQSGNQLSSEMVARKWASHRQSCTSEDESVPVGSTSLDPQRDRLPTNVRSAPATPRADQPPSLIGPGTPLRADTVEMAHDSLNSTMSAAQWFYDDDGQDPTQVDAQTHLGSEMARAESAAGHGAQSIQQRSYSVGNTSSGLPNPGPPSGRYSPARSADGLRQRHSQSTSSSNGRHTGAPADSSTHSRGI